MEYFKNTHIRMTLLSHTQQREKESGTIRVFWNVGKIELVPACVKPTASALNSHQALIKLSGCVESLSGEECHWGRPSRARRKRWEGLKEDRCGGWGVGGDLDDRWGEILAGRDISKSNKEHVIRTIMVTLKQTLNILNISQEEYFKSQFVVTYFRFGDIL